MPTPNNSYGSICLPVFPSESIIKQSLNYKTKKWKIKINPVKNRSGKRQAV